MNSGSTPKLASNARAGGLRNGPFDRRQARLPSPPLEEYRTDFGATPLDVPGDEPENPSRDPDRNTPAADLAWAWPG